MRMLTMRWGPSYRWLASHPGGGVALPAALLAWLACSSNGTAPGQGPPSMHPDASTNDAATNGDADRTESAADVSMTSTMDAAEAAAPEGAANPVDAADERSTVGEAAVDGVADATPAPMLVTLTQDGGWSWFQSPRAIFVGRRLIVGSVAAGVADPARRGDVEAIVYDLATSTSTVVELHNQLELDDHDSAVFLPRPDGRLLALYAKHDSENHFYYRISQPNDPLTWMPENTFVPSATSSVTYSNLFLLPAENNRVYDFYRGLNGSFKPSYAYSDDLGQIWTSGRVIIDFPSDATLQRPYVRYASNGVDTVHFLYTDAHPRDFDNSLYHLYYKAGTLYRSDGTPIHPLTQGLALPSEGTRIYQGGPQNVAWCVDIVLDSAGRPVAAYSVQLNSAGLPVGQGGTDIRYRYARWDGQAWQDHAVAYAGTRLYSGEDDYSGLVAIDPVDPSIVYFSTNADPVTGAPLVSTADNARHYEIFQGRTSDGGATFTFNSITRNSSADNLRPIVPAPAADGQRALLWLRGRYTAYTNYQQEVVAMFWRD